MPLAALLGFGHKKLTDLFFPKPAVKPENVIVIGLKDLDTGEKEFIKNHDLKSFFIKDIESDGLKPVFTAISQLIKNTQDVWVSLDLDCVDSSHAPGVGMPNKGGLTYREIYAISEHIGKCSKILGMDLVEYNPVNDFEHKTAVLATELSAKLFGKEFSNYTSYLSHHSLSKR